MSLKKGLSHGKSQNEKYKQLVKCNTKSYEVQYVHCRGKYEDQPNRPRSLVMKLLRFKDKEEILKRGKKLKGTSIFVN